MEEGRYRGGKGFLVLLLGVVMPSLSITIETTTHICADIFFDPIPTTLHVIFVIFVPLAQLHSWFAIRKGDPARLAVASFLNTIVIGLSIFYSIVYLSIIPLAILTLILGLGLLPLAPYFSLLAALMMRREFKRIAASAPSRSIFALKTKGLLAGLAIIFASLLAIELPGTLTRIALEHANSASPQTRASGIRFLRRYGNHDELLRNCYNQSGKATDLIGYALAISNPIPPERAREIYYLVTGKTFDASIPPRRVGGGRLAPQDTFDFDSDQGGTTITGKLRGLDLAESKLAATVDAEGGVGYMQWSLVFRNNSYTPREARAEVQLPPGGVVTRLTLWVNGEEREAAFAGRGQVRAAYQQVAIKQRRDPVLITTAGHDRILVQCFPVPPHAEMKIRFGITTPLLLLNLNEAKLVLPHFLDRNFRIPDEVEHAVWLQSKSLFKKNDLNLTAEYREALSILRGTIKDNRLSEPDAVIPVMRTGVTEMWSKDPFNEGFFIRQSIVERAPAPLQRIVIVVDTSERMSKWISHIESALSTLPADLDVKLVLADSDGLAASGITDSPADGVDQIKYALGQASFEGGADNAPALAKAWDLAARKPGINAIVWVHDPQLVQIQPVSNLIQRWETRPYGPRLYSVQTTTGVDVIDKLLDGLEEVKTVARTASLDMDLKLLFEQLTDRTKTLSYVRKSTSEESQKETVGIVEASDHLARLWANDEVNRILAPRDESLRAAAVTLAARYQLVTPVTGAVVLENQEQYKSNGLQPVDAGTVPTIPEPEMVLLMVVAWLVLMWPLLMKYLNFRRSRVL